MAVQKLIRWWKIVQSKTYFFANYSMNSAIICIFKMAVASTLQFIRSHLQVINNLLNNSSIPRFFGMANSLMLLVLCFKVKVMHWVKAIRHFKPAEVSPY